MKDLNYTMENAQHSIISGQCSILNSILWIFYWQTFPRKIFPTLSRTKKVENSNQSLNNIEHNLVELNNILSAAQNSDIKSDS